jgi:glycogen phosphorylase
MTVNVRIDGATFASTVAALRAGVLAKLVHTVGKTPQTASERDWLTATMLAVRARIAERWDGGGGHKRVYYLSLEFLIGRLLFDALANLDLIEPMRAALADLGVDLDRLRSVEPDAALGNGGLGRLAACYMDSMAALAVPARGYGIRYEHGLFRQVIHDGWQRESPEAWLAAGNPWEFARPDLNLEIGFGGSVATSARPDGSTQRVWRPAEIVLAAAHDTPIVGWRGRHVNTLRLWAARAREPLHLDRFNDGDHHGALADRMRAEAISLLLYPSDATAAGQELRLRQEYFFTAASLKDLMRQHLAEGGDIRGLAEAAAIQLNDTHPAIAVAELMRLLVDEHGLPWAEAWAVTTRTIAYTNHTLLPEALESWPVSLMERLLPRHVEIIREIDGLHLDGLRADGCGEAQLAAVALIDHRHEPRIRMGHLAFLGSHKVNGVSALHTSLMRQTVFRDFHALYPDRIVNKTNGISFRRWLHQANPGLTRLLADIVGERLRDDAGALEKLVPHAGDTALHQRLAALRRGHKEALARIILQRTGVAVDPAAMFDVQIKRIHEYKRQLLNLIEALALYLEIKAHPNRDGVPRVKILAGKAAASYQQAKLVIKLANDIAELVNNDPAVRGLLKVVFLPDYNVSLAEAIIPAADLSEQISTAGMEASGTGNMKLALNGALTIGTLDGANVEIRDRVGADHIHIFGLTAAEVEERRARGTHAGGAIAASPRLAATLEAIASGTVSPAEPHRFRGLIESLIAHDYFLVTADFDAYFAAQRAIDRRWLHPPAWWRASVLNTAQVAWFSADRAIAEYAEEIWRVPAAWPEREQARSS